MSAETSGDVCRIQDEDVLRRMWQDTEDFGKKKEIRSHMYKLREERLRNFYTSSSDSSNDKSLKEGNGPTHADSLADHSFLSLKSKEIRDSESPTREMSYRVTTKTGGDQGWNVVSKNESSPDGKTHTTSRVATTSGTDKIDGGVANYAAKCEQQASVYNDGDANNFTKSVQASSRNVIQQEAKGGDDNSRFQSTSTSTSSSSKQVTQHHSTSGDTTNLKALPSNVDDSSSATVIRRTYTTDVPADLKRNPNYIDANTKVTTETRTLPDGTKVTTTRYETKGGKSVATSSSDHYSTSSNQVVSEQRSSTAKTSSSKTETHSSNQTIQDDSNRSRIIKQTDNNQNLRHVPDNFNDNDRQVCVKIIRSTNDAGNQNVSQQNISKTSSSTVQKSHKVVDSRNVDVNVESSRDVHDTTRNAVNKTHDTERNVDIHRQFTTTNNQDVHGTHQDDVRTIRIIRENEYLPRDQQPNEQTTTTTTVRREVVTGRDGKTTQDIRKNTQDDVHNIRIIQETDTQPNLGRPPTDQTTSTTTTIRREIVTGRDDTVNQKTTQDVRANTQDDVRITRLIQEKEYTPRGTQPGFGRPPNQQTNTTTVHREIVTTRDDSITGKPVPDDVRITRLIQEKEYTPRSTQPADQQINTTTTVRKEVINQGDTVKTHRTTQNVHGTTQDVVRTTKVIPEGEYCPRAPQPDFGPTPTDHQPGGLRQEVVTSRKEVVTKSTEQKMPITTQDNVHVTKIIREYGTPGEQTPVPSTPGDRTPALSTPGDRTPIGRTPGSRTPALQEVVSQLVPQHAKPDQPDFYHTQTTITTRVDNLTDKRKVATDDFINKERTHFKDTQPEQKEPTPQYEKPERREPIKPGKSELDQKPTPTDGQYQTTYRTDYVSKRISVDISPTHDAFARSLRAISPDRDKKKGSTRSLKSSTSSLRSSTSPEKYPTDRRHPDRKPTIDSRGSSPTKRPSPDKFTSVCSPRGSPTKQAPNEPINTDTITKRRKDDSYITKTTTVTRSPERKPVKPDGYDTITKTKHVTRDDRSTTVKKTTDTNETIDSSTLTRRPKNRPRSRSTSPTSIASDIEFVKSSEIITDLDVDDTVTSTTTRKVDTKRTTTDSFDKRPSSLNVTTTTTKTKTRKITDRSPTSPLTEPSRKSPTKDRPQDKPLKRRDTYEERCRQILGIDKSTTDKNVTEVRKTTSTMRPRKPSTDDSPRTSSKSPEKPRSPSKDIREFPKKSPEKQPLEKVPARIRPTKDAPKVQEFPAQIRRSPEKPIFERPPDKHRPTKEGPKINEFPSQIRRSPEKPSCKRPPEKHRPAKEAPKIQEFPGQIRRSPEKQPLDKYPEKVRPTKDRPGVNEYPSQVKRVPGVGKVPGGADEPLFTKKFISTLCRDEEVERTTSSRSPERSPLDYPGTDKPHRVVKKDSPEKSLKEFPSQREPKEPSPERTTKTFIDTERTDTDITITGYDREPKRHAKPDRSSPDRKSVIERYDTDRRTTTTDITEYTDEYCTPDTEGRKPTKSDRRSPTRIPVGSRVTQHTDVTEYTDEYTTPDDDERKPLRPDRASPTRSTLDSETRRTKTTDVTEYTDEYRTQVTSEDDLPTRGVPADRRPDRQSPDRFKGVTQYTDDYSTTDQQRSTTTRNQKSTKIDTYDVETTDSELDRDTTKRVVKETTTRTLNGHAPRPTQSPSKTGPRPETRPKTGVSEYPSQKPKTEKTTTTKTTTGLTRKDKRDETITQYDIDVYDVEVDDTVRTHRIDDYYTNKTTKTVTNGDGPKRRTSPKRHEPKATKPGVTEYPAQKTPDRKKPLTDKPSKPTKEVPQRIHGGSVPDRRTPKRQEPTKVIGSAYDKPRSPDRYSPSRHTTETEKIYKTQTNRKTVTKTNTYETKPKAKSPTKTIPRQPDQPTGKRHIVTTTIQVSPKSRSPKTTVAHSTVTVKTNRLTQPKPIFERPKPRKPAQNGRATTEDDSETEYEIVDEVTGTRRVTEDTCKVTRHSDAKITRTTSDQIIKTPYRTPVRGQSKPDVLTPSKPSRRTPETDRTTRKTDKKIITTKSIIINNDFDDEKEIVVNLQRSKSSREPTPDRIYPRLASEDEDTGVPRYPDQISEPDEPGSRRKPTRLSDIPIIESEDTTQFTRITQLDDSRTDVKRNVDRVDETDECLLRVNQKVSKFTDQADKVNRKPSSPTRKSPRPDIIVDETTETNRYRGVSDKVTKFATTSEQLTTRQRSPERPKSPKCKSYPDVDVDDDGFTSVSEKVSHFIETAEKVKYPQKPGVKDGPAPRIKRPDFTEVEENIRTDDCLLSVSDKVTKFTTAQKYGTPDYKKPVSLAKIDITPKRESPTRESPLRESPRRESPRREVSTRESPRREVSTRESPRREVPTRESPRREVPTRESPRRESPRRESPSKITTECVQIDSEEQTYTRRLSPDRYSPTRRGSSPKPYAGDKTPTRQTTLTKTDVQHSKYSTSRNDSSVRDIDSTPKTSRKDDEPRSVLSPTGRLRSTESIRRAKELFENMAKEQTVTKQRDILNRPSVFDGRKPKQPNDAKYTTKTTKKEDVKLTDIGVYNVRTTDTKTRNQTSKHRYSSEEDLETTDTTRRTYLKDDHLKSTRLIMDKLNRPRSPEKDLEVPGYMRPLERSRPHSPHYDRSRSPRPSSNSPSRDRSPRPHDPSLDQIPHYMWPLDRSVHDHDHSSDRERSQSRSPSRERTPDLHGKLRSRGSTPDHTVPGYMRPLDRHVRPSPHHSVTELDERDSKRHHTVDEKFGVNLRRTDSGRTTTTTTLTSTSSQRRKLSTIEIERILATHEIEEIYEIEILEILLERATTYEQRRRIRSQIRIVKQLIAEDKLSTVTTKKTSKTVSPSRDAPKNRGRSQDKPTDRKSVDKSRTEYQTEYVRKVSPSTRAVDNRTYQHSDIVTKRSDVSKKSEYQSSYAYSERRTSSEVKTQVRGSSPETKLVRGKSPEKAPRKSITTVEKISRRSPERKTESTETKSVFKTELKRTTPVTKTVVVEKPSWMTQKTLKKTTDVVPTSKKTSTTTTVSKKQTSRTSPSKERKPTDVITSSYGVGPTDENGTPLFGLRALRAQNRTDTTKVQGTVIRSHYYSENGQEPTGEVSVTKYSTDPRDLDGGAEDRNGLVSVTTTQKFGTKGTPSYKTITDKKKITDIDDEECETVTKKSTTTKVSRRGSVKEMSKKFIDNAVETSKNERQSSYPKAGLILRTSSFKDTARSGTGSSRESSPEKDSVCRTVTVQKSTTSSSSGGRTDTFLNNKTRVRGVQDVITRMKNADDDDQAGDSAEDREARTLLNKFIGSQVILSGMETRSSTTSSSSPSTTVRRTTTTTSTTSKGGGKPTVITRTFTHPINEEDLSTVWDDQTLKLLLERSTDYEERQLIRTRIREVMAEQEACADVVAKSKEETGGGGGRVEEQVETSKRTFTEGPVTTTQVTTRVTSQQVPKKPISPFAKFRQLDKQNSINTPPGTPKTPTGSRPLFKFTDPALSYQASTVKERLLQWCQMKTKEYENVQLDNFSSSWADGLAFCALIHHFLPDAFDYHALTPKERRHNFTLAFRIADEKADILPLLDVDDMVATRKPDWKCVFTYVQTIYSRFKAED